MSPALSWSVCYRSSDGKRSVSVGSHVRLRHRDRAVSLVVPLHRELKRGTLNGILRDAAVSRDELRDLL